MRILFIGIKGKMGRQIYNELKANGYRCDGLDLVSSKDVKYHSLDEVNINDYDVLIDFSNKDISFVASKLFLENSKKVISGTTGIKKKDIIYLSKLAKKNNTKYIHRFNFSKSYCIFEEALKFFKDNYSNNAIIESHDISKKDKPSGSALRIKDILKTKNQNVYSLRLNETCPSHIVIFTNENERIVMLHQVLNKKSFVIGFMEIFKKEIGG